MNALEHRIPPPLVVIIVAVMMWSTTFVAPAIGIERSTRLAIAGAFVLFGLVVGALGFAAFGRAKTTIDPVNIDAASALVTASVFRFTRNPMYVGFAALLVGWAVYLAVPWAALGPIAFVLFITRFQIVPEERVMRSKFGAQYADYQRRVRRWL